MSKELFCTNFVTGESEWPSPITRGQTRINLEKDITLIKSLPSNIFQILGEHHTV